MVRIGVRAHSLSVARALSRLAAGDASRLRTAQYAAGAADNRFHVGARLRRRRPSRRMTGLRPPASDDRGARWITVRALRHRARQRAGSAATAGIN